MTINKFAEAIGVGSHYVKSRILSGEIPATEVKKVKKVTYDIDPALVPTWKDKIAQKELSSADMMVKKYRKKRSMKETSLQKAVRELNEFNEKTGKNLSYGEAVSMGVI